MSNLVGTILLQKYLVKKKIGEGSYGEIYLGIIINLVNI